MARLTLPVLEISLVSLMEIHQLYLGKVPHVGS